MAIVKLPSDISALVNLRVICHQYTIWRLSGLWLLSTDSRFIRIVAHINFVICFILFNGCMMMHLPFATSIDDAVDTLLPAATTIAISIKACVLMRNRHMVLQLFRIANKMERSSDNNAKETEYLRRMNRNSIWLMSGIFVGCITTVFGKFVIATLSRHRNLMWNAWFPFEWENTESEWPYRGALTFQCVFQSFFCIWFMTLNTYGPMWYSMLGAGLDILAARLQRLGKATNKMETNADRWNELKKCIEYHNLCLEFKQTVEQLLSVHYAMQFGSSSVLLCVIAYLLTLGSPTDDWVRTAYLGTYIFNMSNELVIPCYFGSVLLMKSERLTNAAYACDWTAHPETRFRRGLLVFMVGAERPVSMSTWQNLFVVELQTFVMVYRTAYSMLSFLNGF